MDQELKERWVNALRSGEYKQGKGMLRSLDDRFCCLGVLCDIVDPDGWWENPGAGRYVFKHGLGGNAGVLPGPMQQDLRISNNAMGTLISLNDTLGHKFDEIADWVEANL